ncbi:hypothetical protein PILCRDRAFT_376956 [Piloderma croceum F 1598]|uniref:C2H2-type domain-containing protein n=1 Tax=Piloderma croceum (strain F 1598) TaxID=765440 RepID=A0A0C3FLM3_PILCF|nr:hypothetical protein PILCRDRAFT_376956 [Piloderma croceum F 1598]
MVFTMFNGEILNNSTFFSSGQELYSTLAAAHDLHHATDTKALSYADGPATHRDAGLNYPSKFSYHAFWNPIDVIWGPSGHAYTLPFQANLEQRWGAVGVDPRKVNDIGHSFQRETAKENAAADTSVHFPEGQSLALGVMDAETEPAGTPFPAVLPTANDHPHTASSKSGSSGSSSYEEPNNDHGTNSQSTHTRAIAPLPQRSSGMLSASAHMSKQIHNTPSLNRTQRSMSRGSRLSSPESSFYSDDDYIESSSGATKRRTGAGFKKFRTVGRTTAILKDTAPAPTARAAPFPGTRRRYPCPHEGCPQVCDRPHDLDRHLESKAHKAPSYKCLACSRLFTRQDPLKRHMDGRCQVMKAERQARSKAKRQRTK